MKPKTTRTMKTITMRTILNALVKELGINEGKSIFEWYCKTYRVNITDNAPASVAHEVLGL